MNIRVAAESRLEPWQLTRVDGRTATASALGAGLLRFCELSAGAALLNGHDLASYAADDGVSSR